MGYPLVHLCTTMFYIMNYHYGISLVVFIDYYIPLTIIYHSFFLNNGTIYNIPIYMYIPSLTICKSWTMINHTYIYIYVALYNGTTNGEWWSPWRWRGRETEWPRASPGAVVWEWRSPTATRLGWKSLKLGRPKSRKSIWRWSKLETMAIFG